MKPLKQNFFMRDTTQVAEDLLGCYLVRKIKNFTLVGRIVETEAYLGFKDPCCHSFNGSYTDRTKTCTSLEVIAMFILPKECIIALMWLQKVRKNQRLFWLGPWSLLKELLK